MTLDEAIRILDNLDHGPRDGLAQEEETALQLGIEAMRELGVHRLFMHKGEFELLPGETKD